MKLIMGTMLLALSTLLALPVMAEQGKDNGLHRGNGYYRHGRGAHYYGTGVWTHRTNGVYFQDPHYAHKAARKADKAYYKAARKGSYR